MAKRTLTASENNVCFGCNWTAGETRTVDVPKDADLPDWLTVSKGKKTAAKKAAAEQSEATPEEG